MPLTPGTRLGPYEVAGSLGAGGMGEVYRATDARLKRDVALKILPTELALDPERLARFDREAQALAALNHPHIAQVYGFVHDGDVRAIAMELVEGPTLGERIARGPLPPDEALPLAIQLADALEYAHEHGIVHRDLKPANIKLTADGAVKVLDFGLAKVLAVDGTPPEADLLGDSPTMPFDFRSGHPEHGRGVASPARLREGDGAAGTQMGVILGTAAYMAPEQARGAAVDKRADIWAFGVVLFEMLTGKVCFAGDTVTDVLAAVVKTEPDWNALPGGTPPRLRELLLRCLTKDRKQRLHDIGDARLELEAILAAPSASIAEGRASKSRGRLPWLAATMSLVALGGMTVFVVGGFWSREARVEPPAARFHISPPQGLQIPLRPHAASIAPDGEVVAYVAEAVGGQSALWIRPIGLSDEDAWRVPGSEGVVAAPFWKPDGRQIAFAVPGALKRFDIQSRTGWPVCLLPADTDPDIDGAWSPSGQLVYGVSATSSNFAGSLWQVPAVGGEATPLIPSRAHDQENWAYPQFLPDGRLLVAVFMAGGRMELGRFTLGKRELDTRTPIDPSGPRGPVTLAAGQLVFGGENTLLAQSVDEATLRPRGEPRVITSGVQFGRMFTALVPHFSLAQSALLYRAGGVTRSRFSLLDRSGAAIAGVVGDPGEWMTFSASEDGRVIASGCQEPGKVGIWTIDIATGKTTQLQPERELATDPTLGRNGFVTYGLGLTAREVWEAPIGGGSATKLTVTGEVLQDRSRDGAWLLVGELTALRARAVTSGQSHDIVTDGQMVDQGRFSPDGRTVAYNSSKSGRFEVWVVRMPPTGEKRQVSSHGGVQPQWSANGKELFYLSPDGTLMAVDINCPASARCQIGEPHALFPTGIRGPSHQVEEYASIGNGQRFVILRPSADAGPLAVLLNWREMLKDK